MLELLHTCYTMVTISGLGTVDRERLSELIRRSKGTISVAEAADILRMTPINAAKILSRLARKGWLSRVKRGLYVPVPLESRTSDIPFEDPWPIAERVYAPCYIGGWSAAEYWDLTEQIFSTVVVMTTQRPRNRKQFIKGTNFLIRTVSEETLFGLKAIWRGQVKVSVSDPTRTIIDMLNVPRIGGGLRPIVDMLRNYLRSKYCDTELLFKYSDQLGNGAVFKRLGYLLERLSPEERSIINAFRTRLTKGNAMIYPGLGAGRLITRWRLWVPRYWAVESKID